MKYLYLVLLCLFGSPALTQTSTRLYGIITSTDDTPLANVTIKVDDKIVGQSDAEGRYDLRVPGNGIVVGFSKIGFETITIELNLSEETNYHQNIVLKVEPQSLNEVSIIDKKENITNTVSVDPHLSAFLPSVSANFESLLKTLPGISTNNELTSQYSVRGGNFDENLVYVNDIEVFRPFLVRNGQQEGLSFINPDLASKIKFSAGGFEAKYGDKLSSVLDVNYGKPDSTEISVTAGILGYSGTLKLLSENGKSYLLAGMRQKFNQSILKKQPTKGSYNPNFYDFQLVYNRDINSRLNVSYFGNFNLNKFELIPTTSETKFGTLQERLRLQVYYQGKEQNRHESIMNALTFTYKPSDQFYFKWINSAFIIKETENIDIEGRYIFDEFNADNREVGKAESNRSIGSNLMYADNRLRADIISSEVKTHLQKGRSYFESGIRYQFDKINDILNEYSVVDTGSYTTPDTNNLSDVIFTNNAVSTSRVSVYLQDIIALSSGVTLSVGIRGNYNSRNDETLVTPRFSLAYQPYGNSGTLYRLSAGGYVQPGVYREMRDYDGTLNTLSKAQKSMHFLAGIDRGVTTFNTALKFTSEVYYKSLTNLIPYKVENLKVRYLANQRAKGYAAGADFSLSGEFVKDMESSFRLSLLKTAEDIKDDFFISRDAGGNEVRSEPGYLRRATDQRINISIFFQDKLFNSPSNKVHMSFLYGSALPVGPPQTERYRDVFTIPAYKRADIGFSKDFLDPSSKSNSVTFKKYFSSFILYAGIFNLLDNNNTVSYLWLTDIDSNQHAVPNYLTGRQLNVKLIANFR